MLGHVKKEYILEGLCCPNCAAKICERVKALDGVHGANIDVASCQLVVKVNKNYEGDLKSDVEKIAVTVDSDIVVKEK